MANTLTNLYTQLKSTIIGTKTTKIDLALDKAVKDIISYKSHSGRNGYIDLVRTVIAKSTTNTTFGHAGLYGQGQSGPASLGQGARLLRYRTYDSIISNISYAFRALNVLTDNILSPDDITKVSLDVKPKDYLEDETPTDSKIKRVKEVIKILKIEERLDIIVKSTLTYGDLFCEIASPKTALTSKSMLTEGDNYRQYIQNQIDQGNRNVWTETIGKNKLRVSIDYSSFNEQEAEIDSSKLLSNLSLIMHKPNLVVKLQSALFPVCFGYLVFPDIRGLTKGYTGIEDDTVNTLCMNILKNLETKLPQMGEFRDNKE
jgi:hypothetical protein